MEFDIDSHQMLARVILPCARCKYAKRIENKGDLLSVECEFHSCEGELEELVRKARTCEHYFQSMECLSSNIRKSATSCLN